ncbi:MAG: SCO family protein [Candidatus Zixiibacteriota bacterium]
MRIVLVVASLLLILVIAVGVVYLADQSRSQLPDLGRVPPFEFTERSGDTFGLNEMQGRLAVCDFMFTSCVSICPTMSANMADLYRAFHGSDKVRFVSITVDPKNDTIEALAEYAKDMGVSDDRWLFLRASMDEVRDLSRNGFKLAADGFPMGHSTRFVLIDQAGRIRGYYDGMDEASMRILKQHVRELVKQIP